MTFGRQLPTCEWKLEGSDMLCPTHVCVVEGSPTTSATPVPLLLLRCMYCTIARAQTPYLRLGRLLADEV